MKRLGIALLALPVTLALLLPATARAAGGPHSAGKFGAGLVVGYPGVGLSFNYFMTSKMSLQIDPTFYFRDNSRHGGGGEGGIGSRLDLLYWPSTLVSWPFANLDWLIGPGLNIYVGNGGFALGAEVPLGISLAFKGAPVDVSLELVPVLRLVDSGGADIRLGLGAALSARYYF